MDINQIAEQHQLGSLLKQYHWNRPRHKMLLGLWGIGLLCSPLTVIFLFIPVFIVLYYFIQCIQRVYSRKPIMYLYEKGFIDCRQSKPKAILYTDVETLLVDRSSAHGVRAEFYRLRTKMGKKLIFGLAIENLTEMANLLQERLVEAQLPQMMQRLQNNESVAFGKLEVNANGITRRKKFIPWHEFKGVEVNRSRFGRIRYTHVELLSKQLDYPWQVFQIQEFPNLNLFLSIAQHFQING